MRTECCRNVTTLAGAVLSMRILVWMVKLFLPLRWTQRNQLAGKQHARELADGQSRLTDRVYIP